MDSKLRFAAIYGLLVVVLVGCVAALVVGLSHGVRVERTYIDRPTVDVSVIAKQIPKPQIMDGSQLGLPAGTVCYAGSLPTGAVIACPASG